MTITITLPFPPSVNALFGGGSKQKRFPSKKYKEWLAVCPSLEPLQIKKCAIAYQLYFPDARPRDSQNYLKAVTDYLVKHGVIADDNWRVIYSEFIVPMGIDRENPRVVVHITRMEKE